MIVLLILHAYGYLSCIATSDQVHLKVLKKVEVQIFHAKSESI